MADDRVRQIQAEIDASNARLDEVRAQNEQIHEAVILKYRQIVAKYAVQRTITGKDLAGLFQMLEAQEGKIHLLGKEIQNLERTDRNLDLRLRMIERGEHSVTLPGDD